MKKARFILRIIAGVVLGILVLSLAFGSLWQGFSYITYGALLLFLPLLFVLLLIRYKYAKIAIEESFEQFVLEEYNKGNITKEEKEQPTQFLHDEYVKENKKSLGIIIVVMIMIVAVFLSAVTYGINSWIIH